MSEEQEPQNPVDSSAAAVVEPQAPDASSSFLSDITGNPVIVKLNSGIIYKGILQSVDGFMNLALEKTKEFVGEKETNDYGDVFIRGNNVSYISAV